MGQQITSRCHQKGLVVRPSPKRILHRKVYDPPTCLDVPESKKTCHVISHAKPQKICNIIALSARRSRHCLSCIRKIAWTNNLIEHPSSDTTALHPPRDMVLPCNIAEHTLKLGFQHLCIRAPIMWAVSLSCLGTPGAFSILVVRYSHSCISHQALYVGTNAITQLDFVLPTYSNTIPAVQQALSL